MTPEQKAYATQGLSKLGYTNPDSLELQGFLDENPYKAPVQSNKLAQIGQGLAGVQAQIPTVQAGIDRLKAQPSIARTPNELANLNSQTTSTSTTPVGDLGLTNTTGSDFNTEYENYLKGITAPINEDQIRQQKLAEMQAQIDATNKIFAEKLAQERQTGLGRLGTTTAIGARRGLLGSDFGVSQTRQTEDLNKSQEDLINQERLATISSLMTQARNTASQEIAEKRQAMLGGYEARKAYYAGQEERKTKKAEKAISALVNSGVNLEDLTEEDFNTYAKSYGLSKDDIKAGFNQAKAEQDKLVQEQAKAELENVKTQAEIDKITAEIQKGERDANKPIEVGGYMYTFDGEKWVNSGKKASTGGASGLTPYQQFSATQSIAKDTQARTEQAREMARQAQLIDQSYNNIVAGGDRSLNTQAIITSFNKILDPSSVVRESEYDRTAQGQSLLAQLEGKVQNIASGGAGVTEATLKEAAEIAKKYLEGSKKSIELQNQRAIQMAQQFGLNPDFVTSTGQIDDVGTGKTIDDYRAEFPGATDAELQALMAEEQ